MIQLQIAGMTCEHCQRAVRAALAEVPGAGPVSVDLATGLAQVGGDAELSRLLAAVAEEGYTARLAPPE